MRAGKLKHPVLFQVYKEISNGRGGYSQKWKDVKTLLGNVVPLRGRELFEAQKLSSEITMRVETRWDPELTEDMRIIYREQVLTIQFLLDPEESQVELHAMCKKEGRVNAVRK